MKVTVCELNDNADEFKRDWESLSREVQSQKSDLVVLPEMPFTPWLMKVRERDSQAWDHGVSVHEAAVSLLGQLGNAQVLGTRPVSIEGKRYNRAFLWQRDSGFTDLRDKTYLPDEEGVWEASWYDRGPVDFPVFEAGPARIGVQICTEIWFGDVSRQYGKKGAQLIASPRATGAESLEKWLAGGIALAVMAGAWNCSSNRVSPPNEFPGFGGMGWIIDPDGAVVAKTDKTRPAVTADLDLNQANEARKTYPRYVEE